MSRCATAYFGYGVLVPSNVVCLDDLSELELELVEHGYNASEYVIYDLHSLECVSEFDEPCPMGLIPKVISSPNLALVCANLNIPYEPDWYLCVTYQ